LRKRENYLVNQRSFYTILGKPRKLILDPNELRAHADKSGT